MRACLDSLDPNAPVDYREIAAIVATTWRRVPYRTVGLSGGQGAGKSTLAALFESAFAYYGVRAHVLSLDDFYLDKAARQDLARRVHPLFETRGPPGTHDVELCARTIDALCGGETASGPIFDKGLDDRVGTRVFKAPTDIVLLEGWCVGARPVPAAELARPVNTLEADEDPECLWRTYVNDQLAHGYAALWNRLSALIYLSVPGLFAVQAWREDQELSLPTEQRMNGDEIARFVQHYERTTFSMREDLPSRAEGYVDLDPDHRVRGFRLIPAPPE